MNIVHKVPLNIRRNELRQSCFEFQLVFICYTN